MAAAPVAVAGPAHAACPAPVIAVSPDRGAPGSTVAVTGKHWASDCDDTRFDSDSGTVRTVPPSAVTILFTQNGQTTELKTITADDDYTFKTTLKVPEGASAGFAAFNGRSPQSGPTAPVPFTVMAAQRTGPATGPPTDAEPPRAGTAAFQPAAELPRTGAAEVAPEAAAGLALLLAGSALAYAGRTRPRRTGPRHLYGFPS